MEMEQTGPLYIVKRFALDFSSHNKRVDKVCLTNQVLIEWYRKHANQPRPSWLWLMAKLSTK